MENTQYTFTDTQDWFSFNVETWTSLFSLVQSPCPRVLEIGSWEGRSAVFLLEQLCKDGGEIVCIDHFDLMGTAAGRARHAKVQHNLSVTGKHFRVMDEFSVPALMSLLKEEILREDAGYDWIYVDGSHEADDTFLDGELVWRMAKKGAVVIFDDYGWDKEPAESMHHPKRGIDAFMLLHNGEYERLSGPAQYQVILKKTSDMRIGFIMKGDAVDALAPAFGYGINIALTVDTRFAMAAAAAIRSAIDVTPGRISIYVVDCGLSDQDAENIRLSIPNLPDVTITFFSLPEESLASECGAVWAKIDMLQILPVERVLYLDADVLVRKDLRGLWDADLQGYPIGAARDVGFPNGYGGVGEGPYFNAGVILLDLAQVRVHSGGLETLARTMEGFIFKDQDVLNLHFKDCWTPIDLGWNAQGLGTYANHLSPERNCLVLDDMKKDPSIVHFTGPVHPEMAQVLNPHIQPFTAKPWGYAGAPGHPFEEEWWSIVEKTAWQGVRDSQEYKRDCLEAKEKAIQIGTVMFRERLTSRL